MKIPSRTTSVQNNCEQSKQRKERGLICLVVTIMVYLKLRIKRQCWGWGISYKCLGPSTHPGPLKCPVKYGWKKFCDFCEKFTKLTLLVYFILMSVPSSD